MKEYFVIQDLDSELYLNDLGILDVFKFSRMFKKRSEAVEYLKDYLPYKAYFTILRVYHKVN